jgi:hypothetical protein
MVKHSFMLGGYWDKSSIFCFDLDTMFEEYIEEFETHYNAWIIDIVMKRGYGWCWQQHFKQNNHEQSDIPMLSGGEVYLGYANNQVLDNIEDDVNEFLVLPNQSEIRVLSTLLNAKYSSSINPLRKLPIELLRTLKDFLI